MAIDSNLPEINELKLKVATRFGSSLSVHSDFVSLSDDIFTQTKEHVSETTLERLWNYSTRRYDTVSRRTLDVLAAYAGHKTWEAFVSSIKNEGAEESDIFDKEVVNILELKTGAILKIGWQPDRVCIIRYIGGGRFVAEETRNSKMQAGDSFSCRQFQLHSPVFLENLMDADGNPRGMRYGIALRHGLTMLQFLKS